MTQAIDYDDQLIDLSTNHFSRSKMIHLLRCFWFRTCAENVIQMSEKYHCVQSDVTVPILTDSIEQQCETSNPTDDFTTSCFPSALLHICLPLGSDTSTLCCCLYLIPLSQRNILGY